MFGEHLAATNCNTSATALADSDVGVWSGPLDNITVTAKQSYERRPSAYVRQWDLGVLAKPHGLFYVLESGVARHPDDALLRLSTKTSTKAPWKGLSLDATVEKRGLIELGRPQGLRAFAIRPDAHLIAPIIGYSSQHVQLPNKENDPQFRKALPKLRIYWRKAEREYAKKRSAKGGETLVDVLDWMGKLSAQMKLAHGASKRKTKVVYNESGIELRAARCPRSLIVSGSLYWLVVNTTDEALYLCGIINAPCLQKAWRMSKTSRNHFDKNPWRAVPVPRFSPSNDNHMVIVNAAKLAEREAERSSDGWDNSGESATSLNEAVAALLPEYAALDP